MLDEPIQLFYEMLLNCYTICGWKFDPKLEVLFTNSELPDLYKALLLGRGRDAAILEHASKSDVPMIVSDSMGLMWGVVEKREGSPEHLGDFYVLGPVLNKEPDVKTLESLVAPFELPLRQKWGLIHELGLLPCVSTVVFFQQVVMLHYYVNRQKTRISSFDYYTPGRSAPRKSRWMGMFPTSPP